MGVGISSESLSSKNKIPYSSTLFNQDTESLKKLRIKSIRTIHLNVTQLEENFLQHYSDGSARAVELVERFVFERYGPANFRRRFSLPDLYDEHDAIDVIRFLLDELNKANKDFDSKLSEYRKREERLNDTLAAATRHIKELEDPEHECKKQKELRELIDLKKEYGQKIRTFDNNKNSRIGEIDKLRCSIDKHKEELRIVRKEITEAESSLKNIRESIIKAERTLEKKEKEAATPKSLTKNDASITVRTDVRPKGLLVQLAVAEEKLKIRVSELEKRKEQLESEILQLTSDESPRTSPSVAYDSLKNELIVLEAKRKNLSSIIEKQTEKIESLRNIIHDLSVINSNSASLDRRQPEKTIDKQNIVIYCVILSLLPFAFGLLVA
ncbi:hypothetical protein [Gallibacterium anatis]|uniref:Uncharacterized protein n=1 Tax=Gallibacterium anatis 4895 TaxID=1396510 RepID=A0A0A2ZWE0_9PAST|nr:hypothetical protein [Gallibacterium anatis]KGQ59732.1 hypothetical protein IO48_10955 [Gallibacterium anatis 4895]